MTSIISKHTNYYTQSKILITYKSELIKLQTDYEDLPKT